MNLRPLVAPGLFFALTGTAFVYFSRGAPKRTAPIYGIDEPAAVISERKTFSTLNQMQALYLSSWRNTEKS
jgi:hypothetical protein